MERPRTPHRVTREPIRPNRVRRIGPDGFAFVPNRFLRDGFFAALRPAERELYCLLVLAGDRNGVSFYHYDSLCSLLQMELETYLQARNALIERDLIAFDGTRFQVLSLPEPPTTRELRTPEDFAEHDGATIRATLRRSFPRGSEPNDRTP
ncbi:MAG: hypothetical protein WA825_10140 [Steroidobacteraceae bacterium]